MKTQRETHSPLSWPIIIGLSSLALLWPVTALWPIAGTGATRAVILLGVTGATWIGAVGFARVARPILTLSICGAIHGFLALLPAGILSGTGAIASGPVLLWALVPTVLLSAGVGALCGLAAAGIQAMLGKREQR